MTSDELIDDFFSGKSSLFFLVSAEKEISKLISRDFVREKRPQGLGILCWSSEQNAKDFLDHRVSVGSPQKLVSLSVGEFNKLMDENDPERDDFDGFYLVS